MPQLCSVGTRCLPGGAHGEFLGIALTAIDYMILSDNMAKSMLSFGAEKQNGHWGDVGNGGSGLESSEPASPIR